MALTDLVPLAIEQFAMEHGYGHFDKSSCFICYIFHGHVKWPKGKALGWMSIWR